MPRKSKTEEIDKEELVEKKLKSTKAKESEKALKKSEKTDKKETKSKTSAKKKETTKSVSKTTSKSKTVKKVDKEKSEVKNEKVKENKTKTVKKETTKKKKSDELSTKKATTKKVATKKKIEKKDKKKVTTKKNTKKKENEKAITKKTTTKNKKTYLPEYYDLPYRYNETIVVILAQTPKKLFIYWDISDKDINKYKKVFGENFFDETYPVLLIHNEEMNYTFEVPINDFANSWYVDINDPKCKYTINLGRKFKNINNISYDIKVLKEENINLQNDYLQITNSNILEVPNDHILFEKLGDRVKYKNVKNLEEKYKDIKNIVSQTGNKLEIYNIYDFYMKIYANEIDEDIFDINNPSSGNTSSRMQRR